MRKALLVLACLALAPALHADCNNFAADGVGYNCSMPFNGNARTWIQVIPSGYVSGNALFIGLHGAPSSGAAFDGASMRTYSVTSGANFIYLAPDGGCGSPGNYIWCAGDLEFLRALIQHYISGTAMAGRPLDPNKVFVAGHSAGAAMATEMAVHASDLVAAVFSNEGIFPYNPPYPPPINIDNYGPPMAPVSVLVFKGQFGTFPFCGLLGAQQSIFSVDQELEYFAKADKCSNTTSATFCSGLPQTTTFPQGNLSFRVGTSCTANTEVKAYQIFCGQHAWYDTDVTTNPCTINPYPGLASNPDLGPPNSGATTDSVIWNFFNTHPKSAGGGSPTISLSPTSLSYSATVGGSNPANQSFTVSNIGGGTLSWTGTKTQTWLTISPTSGGTGQVVTCSINITGLSAGTYTDTVTISASGATNTPQTVAITLVIGTGSPTISLSPTTLSYSATAGGSNPANQTFTVTNTGSGTLSWTGTKAQPWLTISPTSRGTGQTVTASINISGLAAGTYTDTITIAAAGATNTPQTVAVTLTLKSARAGSRTRSQSDQSHPPSRLPRK